MTIWKFSQSDLFQMLKAWNTKSIDQFKLLNLSTEEIDELFYGKDLMPLGIMMGLKYDTLQGFLKRSDGYKIWLSSSNFHIIQIDEL